MKKFKFGCVRKLLLASILFPTLLIHAAGVKVSDLPAITSPAGADLALVVDMTAGVTKKLTWTNLLASVLAGETDPVVGAITGLVKSDGAATIAAAIADTDYQQVITWSDGLEYTAGTAKIDHNVTNLKITSSEIDTIQGISSAASPTFTGATLSGLNTANGLVQTDGSGILSTTLSPTGLTSITATTFTGALAGNADTATSLAGGAGGTVPYQSSANTTVMLANGTAGQILQANGTTVAPSWETISAGYTNLTSFVDQTAWSTFYSNTDGDVTELTNGAAGTYLKGNGATSAPTWEVVAVGTGDLKADGTIPLTANWDLGAFTVRGTQFISDIAIGTAPFVVTSTTEVANLKAATVGTIA